jgi:hypothetical protein
MLGCDDVITILLFYQKNSIEPYEIKIYLQYLFGIIIKCFFAKKIVTITIILLMSIKN